jgi:hypothetical protein
MADPTLQLVPGVQRWLIARTDRDGASSEEIADMLSGFLQWSFRDLVVGDQPGASPEELWTTADHEWRVSAARPIRLLESPRQTEPDIGQGRVIAAREQLEDLPLVNAARPWFIFIEIWWRGPPATIAWPCLTVGTFGHRSRDYSEADWLLLRSVLPVAEIADPGDATWSEAQAERIDDVVDAVKNSTVSAVKAVLIALGFGAALYFFGRAGARRR